MFKFIFYPILFASTLVLMSHTHLPSINGAHEVNPVNNFVEGKPAAFTKEARLANYKLWNLDKIGLSQNAFELAMKGFNYLSIKKQVTKKNIVSIVDFSKPSTEKRLYVIDVNTGEILFRTWVAHGQNSGERYANKFSNSLESHQSSLGFFITMDTYIGGHGYSLRLKGCEKGINDKAYERDIVIHGADYVSREFINSRGVLGRSYGCPAVPAELSQQIINTIKNGSCLFLYHPTKKYYRRSKILNSQV